MKLAWICLKQSIFLHFVRRDKEGCVRRSSKGGLDAGGMWKAEVLKVNGKVGSAIVLFFDENDGKPKTKPRERGQNFSFVHFCMD